MCVKESADRALDRIHPIPVTGCWLWDGADSGDGYGKIKVDGKSRYVHRVIWEALYGPIPEGMVLDHLCRVRCCCNPAHLELVTVKENTHRGEAVLFRKETEPRSENQDDNNAISG